ncbi:hypothetical protein HELRODRAFT_188284 [Helobdella robusta]|uniref:BTB domain-containing protein n=1 Tax=Helobdella robusta TaxID=6412 RepID=T1FPT9_HELRO|nr:hypothetical protein HELRODRAFT_188284 [Helobdella robusta]ESO06172.1 hypothetical protein HELRODRAFT_188284 [Helobdella robusta]
MRKGLGDVSITTSDGAEVSCHKCVLVARMEYFRSMFASHWMETNNMAPIKLAIESRVFHVLLHYLYYDSLDGSSSYDLDLLCHCLVASDQYLLPRLQSIIEVELSQMGFTLKNVCNLFHLSSVCNATQLKDKCLEFMTINIAILFEIGAFKYMEESLLKDVSACYREKILHGRNRAIGPYTHVPLLGDQSEETASSQEVDNMTSPHAYLSGKHKKRRPRTKSSMSEHSFTDDDDIATSSPLEGSFVNEGLKEEIQDEAFNSFDAGDFMLNINKNNNKLERKDADGRGSGAIKEKLNVDSDSGGGDGGDGDGHVDCSAVRLSHATVAASSDLIQVLLTTCNNLKTCLNNNNDINMRCHNPIVNEFVSNIDVSTPVEKGISLKQIIMEEENVTRKIQPKSIKIVKTESKKLSQKDRKRAEREMKSHMSASVDDPGAAAVHRVPFLNIHTNNADNSAALHPNNVTLANVAGASDKFSEICKKSSVKASLPWKILVTSASANVPSSTSQLGASEATTASTNVNVQHFPSLKDVISMQAQASPAAATAAALHRTKMPCKLTTCKQSSSASTHPASNRVAHTSQHLSTSSTSVATSHLITTSKCDSLQQNHITAAASSSSSSVWHTSPISFSSTETTCSGGKVFSAILDEEKKQEEENRRMENKSLHLVQLEEQAMQELYDHYISLSKSSSYGKYKETISVRRATATASRPLWKATQRQL